MVVCEEQRKTLGGVVCMFRGYPDLGRVWAKYSICRRYCAPAVDGRLGYGGRLCDVNGNRAWSDGNGPR